VAAVIDVEDSDTVIDGAPTVVGVVLGLTWNPTVPVIALEPTEVDATTRSAPFDVDEAGTS
jgi:hypothetical protein